MQLIQSPDIMGNTLMGSVSFFVTGGISNCPEWQKELITMLEDVNNLILINPRRSDFDASDLALEEDQIKWEHDHIRRSDGHLFWFPCETICPITLFELGKVSARTKPLVIGVHPDYQRKRDIRWQMLLERPEINIVYSIEAVAEQVRDYCRPDHPRHRVFS